MTDDLDRDWMPATPDTVPDAEEGEPDTPDVRNDPVPEEEPG